MTDRTRTVFLGTGAFAVPIAAALAEHPLIDVVSVVTAPARPGSRGKATDSPVGAWAAERGLATLRPVRLRAPDSVAEVVALAPDLLVLADYGQIVPEALLDLPRHGALNLHPSLLPRHRGAAPIPAAILAADQETGVTLMRMDASLDSGPIVAQWRTALRGRETAPELAETLADLGARLLIATLDHWLAGSIVPEAQPDSGVTLTRPLRRSDGQLDPRHTAAALERQVRAYEPWPGSYLNLGTDRIIVWAAHSDLEAAADADAGTIIRHGRDLAVRTLDGLLVLDDVQPAGGRRMGGADLLRGRPALVGTKVATPADGDA